MSYRFVAFVQEFADENPIEPGANEVNFCRFCYVAWCEDRFEEALAPDPSKPASAYGAFGHTAHAADCLWVRANQLIREL